ncbi:helix-turn-helix transcriptional regulator [Rhodoluna sp. KAS3]|uniref:helix-turn-helix transcriptional regulator n=1 Tax=Rhodoluna sp. KAS3 TaxID=942880 RepID=UPI00222F2FB2|nr:helix-turn-helix transcriptional regulator [Rhodoluna sp. KAS3]BDS48544.1 transcriptional regulator [Rhodoluna sp. KAS3]
MSNSEQQVDQLGVIVRQRRKSLGMTQGELADLAGVSQRFVYDLERGKPSVALDKVLLVCSTLGLRLALEVAN